MIISNFTFEDLKSISNNFSDEIEQSNKGVPTSLRFVIHELPAPYIKDQEIFEILVIGGTICKKAICKKEDNKIIIIKNYKDKKLIVKHGQEFLDFINKEISNNITSLVLNFAYALSPISENKKLDGILLSVSKEISLESLINKKIGCEIEKHIFAKRSKKIKVSVANDTICLLLSGSTNYSWDSLAAGVVGTGINFAFFTQNNIPVNLESGSFNRFTQTKEGKIVDKVSLRPGKSLFEKETSGAYLYKLFNIILKENNINYPQISSTEELNIISCMKTSQISQIALNLLERSAHLVACQIAGIVLFKKQDMTFIMGGSLFRNGNNYKETVIKTVKILVPNYRVTFVEIENSAILGAAKIIA
jgi:hexokinase